MLELMVFFVVLPDPTFNIDPKTSRTSHRLISVSVLVPLPAGKRRRRVGREGGFSIWTRDASVAGVPCLVLCTQGGLNAPTPGHMSEARHASL